MVTGVEPLNSSRTFFRVFARSSLSGHGMLGRQVLRAWIPHRLGDHEDHQPVCDPAWASGCEESIFAEFSADGRGQLALQGDGS